MLNSLFLYKYVLCAVLNIICEIFVIYCKVGVIQQIFVVGFLRYDIFLNFYLHLFAYEYYLLSQTINSHHLMTKCFCFISYSS